MHWPRESETQRWVVYVRGHSGNMLPGSVGDLLRCVLGQSRGYCGVPPTRIFNIWYVKIHEEPLILD